MIKTVQYKDKSYPEFQLNGFASQYAFPFAKQVCKGKGLDIGCNQREWAFEGSVPIDKDFDDGYDALNLPPGEFDYIFSSHCLEHIPNWVDAMDVWYSNLKKGGVLFLYLPDYSQEYWRPWNNKKHIHCMSPQIIKDYMIDKGYENVFCSGIDLLNSFMIFGSKT
jgi:SAM-dependent methyltransferase